MQFNNADSIIKRKAGKKNLSVKMLSVAVITMLMVVGLAVISAPETSAVDQTQTVRYHSNGATGSDISITYLGIVATEYNPLYWDGSFASCPGNWTAPTESHNYGGTVGTMTVNKVFA